MGSGSSRVRVRVSPQVARLLVPEAPRDRQLAAALGLLPLEAGDLATVLFYLGHRSDPEIRTQALSTLRSLPLARLLPAAADPGTPGPVLDFLARCRSGERELIETLLAHPSLSRETVTWIAGHADSDVACLISETPGLSELPEVKAALAANPALVESEPVADEVPAGETEVEEDEPGQEAEGEGEEEEEVNSSKYQLAQEMVVSEKIKTAMTGDKEWRTIFLKDANKLVSSAALKNPRITEGEVLAVAKNRSAHEELIRLINMNREWLKHYEIRRALVMHPRTPLQKALRYMATLTEKDIKNLAKSRNVSQAVANNARRMLMAKLKKR